MLVPNSFKSRMAVKFYDKTIQILQTSTVKEADGGISRTAATVSSTFSGNARLVKKGMETNEIGLTLDADIVITAPTTTQISLNDTIRYLNCKYQVINIVTSDSHLTITGKECQ